VEIRIALSGFAAMTERQLNYLLIQAASYGGKLIMSPLALGKRPDLLVVDYQSEAGRVNAMLAKKIWPSLPVYAVGDQTDMPESLVRVPRAQLFSTLGKVFREHVERYGHQAEALEQAPASSTLRSGPAAEVTTDTNSAPATSSWQRVLVIDDSAVVREHLAQLIQKSGYRVDQSGSAEEARQKLLNTKYDLMLLDVNLPGIDGYAFCKEVRSLKEHRDLPVIMVTSRGGLIDKTRGALAGCKAYLTKPVQAEKLLAILRAHIIKL
jgi:CheY-like chemotaxis protein